MKPVSRFAPVAFLLAAGLALVVFFLNALTAMVVPTVMYYVPFGFAILTAALYANVLKASAPSAQRFVTAFMAAVTTKLLLTASFLGVYIYNFKMQKVPVALGTFIIYVAFTILLVRYLRITGEEDTPQR